MQTLHRESPGSGDSNLEPLQPDRANRSYNLFPTRQCGISSNDSWVHNLNFVLVLHENTSRYKIGFQSEILQHLIVWLRPPFQRRPLKT